MKRISEDNLNHHMKNCLSLSLNTKETIGVLICSIDFISIGNIFIGDFCIISSLLQTLIIL